MRIGQNPAKFVNEVAKPARITGAVLNYIPFTSGFYTEALDVLKVCLESARTEPGLPMDLMVFDNGSCPEVQDWLLGEQRAGRIQYLILSEKNLGKGGAWNIILSGAPGEIIAYADSDVLFSPGWLARSVELLETYPKVGMVTARPFRTNPQYYSSTVSWAQSCSDVTIEAGQLIPFPVFEAFNLSLGQDPLEIRKDYEATQDVGISYRGAGAMVGASHWQFTAYKAVLAQFLPFDMSRPMGQVKQLDQRMNEAGFLRLMVSDPLAMNMSNTLRGVSGKQPGTRKISTNGTIWDLPLVKKILLSFYDKVFRLYYDR